MVQSNGPSARRDLRPRHERSNSRWPITTAFILHIRSTPYSFTIPPMGMNQTASHHLSCTIKSCQKVLIIIMHNVPCLCRIVWRAAKPHQPRLDDLTTVSHINVHYQDGRNPQSFRYLNLLLFHVIINH